MSNNQPPDMSTAVARCLVLAKQGQHADSGDQEYDDACIAALQRLHDDVQLLRQQFKAQIDDISKRFNPGNGGPKLQTLEVNVDDKGDHKTTLH